MVCDKPSLAAVAVFITGIFACPFAAVQTAENNRLLSLQPVIRRFAHRRYAKIHSCSGSSPSIVRRQRSMLL